VTALHCEAEKWTFWEEYKLDLKFRGQVNIDIRCIAVMCVCFVYMVVYVGACCCVHELGYVGV